MNLARVSRPIQGMEYQKPSDVQVKGSVKFCTAQYNDDHKQVYNIYTIPKKDLH